MAKRTPTYRQSGVIAVRFKKKKPEVLLVTTRRRQLWTIPKGIVEPGLSAKKSAAKEAMEEAGIAGAVAGKSVGKYRYSKWGGTCEVEVFPMQVKVVKDRWPEKAFRKRVWLRPGAAAKKLRHRKLARLVKSLEEWIESVDWE